MQSRLPYQPVSIVAQHRMHRPYLPCTESRACPTSTVGQPSPRSVPRSASGDCRDHEKGGKTYYLVHTAVSVCTVTSFSFILCLVSSAAPTKPHATSDSPGILVAPEPAQYVTSPAPARSNFIHFTTLKKQDYRSTRSQPDPKHVCHPHPATPRPSLSNGHEQAQGRGARTVR